MTQQLADATTAVANENNAMVVPVGLAFAKSRFFMRRSRTSLRKALNFSAIAKSRCPKRTP